MDLSLSLSLSRRRNRDNILSFNATIEDFNLGNDKLFLNCIHKQENEMLLVLCFWHHTKPAKRGMMLV